MHPSRPPFGSRVFSHVSSLPVPLHPRIHCLANLALPVQRRTPVVPTSRKRRPRQRHGFAPSCLPQALSCSFTGNIARCSAPLLPPFHHHGGKPFPFHEPVSSTLHDGSGTLLKIADSVTRSCFQRKPSLVETKGWVPSYRRAWCALRRRHCNATVPPWPEERYPPHRASNLN